MIDDKKIEEAASVYGTNNGYSVTGPDGRMSLKPELETAFETGVHWAINEFLKDLLHPASEEPRNLKYIVFTTTMFGEVYLFTKQVDNKQDWKATVECHGIEQWVYRDDIVSLIFKEVKRK